MDMPLKKKELLDLIGHLPKKWLGQNFLIDSNVVDRILNASNVTEEDVVVEIGPGLGVLTYPLSHRALKVIAIEKDKRLVRHLKDRVEHYKNIEVIEADALTFSYRDLSKRFQKRLKLVSNLPYNISTPILFKLLDEREAFTSLLLMLQKEVGERIVAGPGTKQYGSLSVMVQLLSDVSCVFDIPPAAFYPQPKVYSTLISLKILDRPRVEIADLVFFKRLVSASFGHRRKTLKNALKDILGGESERILLKAGIDPKRRGETLNINEFKALYDASIR